MENKYHKSWVCIREETDKDYFKDILIPLIEDTKTVPCKDLVFRSFEIPIEDVKYVLLGQDPYPNRKHACGWSFATLDGTIPASLRNLFTLLERDTPYKAPKDGKLEDWVNKGVLLLNTVLTVEEKNAGCHRKKGWERFTDIILENLKGKDIIFILLGKDAEKKKELLSGEKLVIAGHPSSLNRKWKESNLFIQLEKLDADFYK